MSKRQLIVMFTVLSISVFIMSACSPNQPMDHEEIDISTIGEPAMDNNIEEVSNVKSVKEIENSIGTSNYLDGIHYLAGVECLDCHIELVDGQQPVPPSTDNCLQCHFGSYDALAEKTKELGEKNPHNSHEGQKDCSTCHNVHQPFNNYCATCHAYDVEIRFN